MLQQWSELELRPSIINFVNKLFSRDFVTIVTNIQVVRTAAQRCLKSVLTKKTKDPIWGWVFLVLPLTHHTLNDVSQRRQNMLVWLSFFFYLATNLCKWKFHSKLATPSLLLTLYILEAGRAWEWIHMCLCVRAYVYVCCVCVCVCGVYM